MHVDRKVLFQLLSNREELRKFVLSEWNFPVLDKFLPGYFSFLAGVLASGVIGFIAALLLLPNTKTSGPRPGIDEPEGFALRMPQNPSLKEFEEIGTRNLFNSEGTVAEGVEGVRTCEFKKSLLPIKFTGVIFGGTSETSLVVVESSATRQAEIFLVHDMVPGDAEIVEIEKERLIVEKAGCREFLELEAPPLPKRRVAGTKATRTETVTAGATAEGYREDGFERRGNNIKVERTWINRIIGPEFAKTLQDAKATPNLVGSSEVKGFTVTKIRPNSAYEKMGLQDGDIVESINGIELNGVAQAITTLNAIKSEVNSPGSSSSIIMTVRRGGTPFTLNVEVPR